MNIYSIITSWEEKGKQESCWDIVDNGIYAATKGPDNILGTNDDANIISMSFYGIADCNPSQSYLPKLHEAIQYAYNDNVVMVSIVGNLGDDLQRNESIWPAGFDEVIGVGATDINDKIASFSTTGPFVEVVAPGVDIESTFNSTNTDLSKYTYIRNNYAMSSGTSLAAPHVVGVISLILAKYGKLPVGTFYDKDTTTIRGILHSTAIDLGSKGYDQVYGYGLVQFK